MRTTSGALTIMQQVWLEVSQHGLSFQGKVQRATEYRRETWWSKSMVLTFPAQTVQCAPGPQGPAIVHAKADGPLAHHMPAIAGEVMEANSFSTVRDPLCVRWCTAFVAAV